MTIRRGDPSPGIPGDATDLTSLLRPETQRRVEQHRKQHRARQAKPAYVFGPESPGWDTDTVAETVLRDWHEKYREFDAKTCAVFAAIARGLGNGAIAEQLKLPATAVNVATTRMYDIYGLKSVSSKFAKRNALVRIHACLVRARLVDAEGEGRVGN